MTIDIEKAVNPRVRAANKYNMQHFTTAWQRADGINRAMANEFPYPPLESVQAAVRDIMVKANWYPEDASCCTALREKLAVYTGLEPNNVTFGNGSMELIDILCQTFTSAPGVDQVIIISPDYTAYQVRPPVFGAMVQNRTVGEDTDKAADAILELITPQTKLILFSRPNNPTGKVMPSEDVIRILHSGVPTAIDEAYVELADGDISIARLVNEWDNLIVLRTFSKGFGLAGLRFGYLLANREIIHYVNAARHVLNVNLIALAACSATLDDLENARARMEKLRQTRQWLFEELKIIKGLRPIPSQGNFILIDASASGMKSSDIVQKMFDRGIQLRDFSRKEGLLPDRYFRITVGRREDMEQVVEELRNLL